MEKIHVLLVEDEQTLAMIIKDTLEEQDFIITTAGDGEEGLRKFFEQKPDVLVADVMMPRMDGFEMVRRIRQSDKATPVLFLTARSAINDVVKGFELGANDYLKKPFGMQELIVRLKALMHKAFVEKEITNTYTIGGYQFNSVTQSGFASPLLAAHQHGGHSVGAPVHASAPLGSYAQHPAVETVHPEIFRRYALCQRSHSVLAVPFGKGVHIGK